MKTLKDIFWEINNNPITYLPYKSLSLFQAYWIGYCWRYRMEIKDTEEVNLYGFHEWVACKYKIAINQSSYNIVKLYSKDEMEAFDNWFSLVSEFLMEEDGKLKVGNYIEEKREDFLEIIGKIKQRPAMYVGYKSFTLISHLLKGYCRAIEDFNLQQTEQEKKFKEFQKYIEHRTVYIKGPSWDKIISFYTGSEESALEIFFKWIDEYYSDNIETIF